MLDFSNIHVNCDDTECKLLVSSPSCLRALILFGVVNRRFGDLLYTFLLHTYVCLTLCAIVMQRIGYTVIVPLSLFVSVICQGCPVMNVLFLSETNSCSIAHSPTIANRSYLS